MTSENKNQINFYLLQNFLTREEMKEERTQKSSHTIDVTADAHPRYSRVSVPWDSTHRLCDQTSSKGTGRPDKCHSIVCVLEKQRWNHFK